MPYWRQAKSSVLWFSLLVPLVLYGLNIWQRPDRDALVSQPLFKGIAYTRQVKDRPRPNVIHLIDIDLTTPGLKPYVSPGYEGADLSKSGTQRREVLAQPTSAFLNTHGLQLAVNANFFYQFREVAPWNYYPRSGQTANLVGLAISNGAIVSKVYPYDRMKDRMVPSLCFLEQQALINREGACPDETQQAIAGNLMLLNHGQPTEQVQKQFTANEGKKPYAFTVAALDTQGKRLWLVLVDGKQPLYSEGITLSEVTDLVQSLGADTAIKLDGGGSTTVAIATPAGPKVLNAPIHTKIPGKERPVGNHLGFFAQPLESP